jgi:hypothetical protein
MGGFFVRLANEGEIIESGVDLVRSRRQPVPQALLVVKFEKSLQFFVSLYGRALRLAHRQFGRLWQPEWEHLGANDNARAGPIGGGGHLTLSTYTVGKAG